MDLTGSQWLVAGGLGLVLIGILILWRTSRYDLKGAAIDSAIDLARGKRSADNPTSIEKRLGEIAAEASVSGKARRAAGMAIGHVLAQVLGLAALAFIALGAVLAGWGFYQG